MTTIILNKFDGGQSQDIRTFATDECADSLNFDLYTTPHLLTPIQDPIAETYTTTSMDDVEISDVGTSVVSTNVYLTAFGYEGGSSVQPTAFIRTSGMNGNWTKQATGTNAFQKGTMITFQGKAFCLAYNSGSAQYSLQRYDGGGTLTVVGTFNVTAPIGNGYVVLKPFIHPESKHLYIAVSNVIAKLDKDGTTFTSHSTILPNGFEATSLTDYGGYLAIAIRPRNGSGHSTLLLWGQDTSLNTLQGTIDFGEGNLNVIENIGNQIVGLVYPTIFGSYSSVINKRVEVKTYSGGEVVTIKSIPLDANSSPNILKLKNNNKLYFGLNGTAENAIWCVYKNKSGQWTINKERIVYNGGTTFPDNISGLTGLSSVGDYFYIASTTGDGTDRLMATGSNAYYNLTSKYKTNMNPNMPIEHRSKDKSLQAFSIAYTGTASGNLTLKYSVDGSVFTTAINLTTSAEENVIEATSDTNGAPFDISGREFQFQIESTGGVKIKEFKYKYDNKNSTI